MNQPNPGFDLLARAALVLFAFQIGACAHMMLVQRAEPPSSFLMVVMCTGLFIGAQRRIAASSRAASRWLFASRAVALSALALVSLVLVFRDQLRPPFPALTLQAVFSALWAIIALKGAAAGKFKPGGPVGLCVFWTLHSRLAWERAHRALGRVLFWGGIVGLAASFVIPPLTSFGLWCATVALALTVALFESWRGWSADPQRT